ncbi:glycosyltransferase, group 1 family [Legionella wadsworthii]|uniref:Glycosyltransferase, group 1 family n=1 Tax=Legionella wadsworthii TaxID=28088 RepID=A0A378LM60_9GAMM|nr:glycosyltransferase, group 1 family [Legionella wadsworthii]
MRILILTQWFDPEPTPRGLAFANALKQAGNDVEVITGFPNYPGGKIYSGYQMKWRKREYHNGILINRVALYPSHDQSALKRILNYGSFFLSSCLYGIFFAKKADIIYVYHPPITTGLSAAIIGFLRRTPFILDIQDMWPDTLRATGMLNKKGLLTIIETMCQWLYKRASRITVLSPGFKQLLIQRNVPAEKIEVIYNWCDEETIVNSTLAPAETYLKKENFNVVFAGTMGKAQVLDAVLLAAKKVSEINPRVNFVLIGGGIEKERLQQMAVDQSIKNIHFLPRVPTHEIGSILRASDVLLVHLKDDPLFEITIPSKIQAYLAIGKPILIAAKGDAVNLVLTAKAGMNTEPENVSRIAETVLQMAELSPSKLTEMGSQGAHYYKECLSMNVGVANFLKMFHYIVELNSSAK